LLTSVSAHAIAEPRSHEPPKFEEPPMRSDVVSCDQGLHDEIDKILRDNIAGVMLQIKELLSTWNKTEAQHAAADFHSIIQSTGPTKLQGLRNQPSMDVATDITQSIDTRNAAKTKLETMKTSLRSSGSTDSIGTTFQRSASEAFKQPVIHCYRKADDIRQSLKKGRSFLLIEDFCSQFAEPDRTGCLSDFVSSSTFELGMIIIIFTNIVHTLHQTNRLMSNPHAGSDAVSSLVEVAFTMLYFIEFGLKFLVHRCYMFCNSDKWWNGFDFAIVSVGAFELLLIYVQGGRKTFSANILRIMRVIKVVKVFRAVRVIHFVKELRLMLKCVLGSFISLIWSFILLGGISLLFAIVVVQQLTSAVVDGQLPADQIDIIYERFGSVQQASLTMLKSISGGEDWGPIYDSISKAGIMNSICFLVYVLFVWLSVTNIITAIFVDKALKNARPDADDAMMEKHQDDLGKMKELQSIFRSMDHDNSGTLTLAELQSSFRDCRILSFFEMQGLDIKSSETFFELLTQISKTHEVDMESFVTGCLKMRGYATNIDVFMLLFQTQALGDNLLRAIRHLKQEVGSLQVQATGVAP